LPDRVFLHPIGEYDSEMAPRRGGDGTDGLTHVYISIDNPRDFKIDASPAEPE